MDTETLAVSEPTVLCPSSRPRCPKTGGHADSRPGGRVLLLPAPSRSARHGSFWPLSTRGPRDRRCPGGHVIRRRFPLSAAPVEAAGARHNRRSASAASLMRAATVSTASRSVWRRASSRAASVARCERASTARIDRTDAEGVTAAQQHAAPGRDRPAGRVNGSLRHTSCILLSSRDECVECRIPCRSLPAQ